VGNLTVEHIAAYGSLGAFIQYCYSKPLASNTFDGVNGVLTVSGGWRDRSSFALILL
jgi:hypothetical protein